MLNYTIRTVLRMTSSGALLNLLLFQSSKNRQFCRQEAGLALTDSLFVSFIPIAFENLWSAERFNLPTITVKPWRETGRKLGRKLFPEMPGYGIQRYNAFMLHDKLHG